MEKLETQCQEFFVDIVFPPSVAARCLFFVTNEKYLSLNDTNGVPLI